MKASGTAPKVLMASVVGRWVGGPRKFDQCRGAIGNRYVGTCNCLQPPDNLASQHSLTFHLLEGDVRVLT